MQPVYLCAVLIFTVLPARILCQNIGFTQNDYPSNEDGQSITVEVSRRGSHSEEIPLQIIPLTLDDYETQFPDLPCGPVADLLGQDDPAESNDFNNTIISKSVPPISSGESQTFPFSVAITSDNRIEPNEVFLIILNFADETGLTIGRRCALGRIPGTSIRQLQDIDFVNISTPLSIDASNIQLRERDATLVLFSVTKIIESELDIQILLQITNTNGNINTDLELSSTPIRITPAETGAELSVIIFDDEMVEDTEFFEIELIARVIDSQIMQEFTTRVEILDDEVVQVGFVDEEVSIVEGNRFEVCISVNVSILDYIRFGDEFTVSSSDESAIGGVDYIIPDQISSSRIYRPIESDAQGLRCFFVSTPENSVIDGPRSFTISFDDGQETDLTIIEPSSIRLYIIDDDAVPNTPEILEIKPSENESLVVTWRADVSPEKPITGFYGNVTARTLPTTTSDRGARSLEEDGFEEFTTNSSITTYTLPGFQDDRVYDVIICSENVNGRNCTFDAFNPFQMPTTTAQGATDEVDAPKLSPGLIAGIVVIIVVLLLFCCVLLLFLILCLCWGGEREKAYFPGKAEKKELRGKGSSPDDYSFDEEEEFSYSSAPTKTAL